MQVSYGKRFGFCKVFEKDQVYDWNSVSHELWIVFETLKAFLFFV